MCKRSFIRTLSFCQHDNIIQPFKLISEWQTVISVCVIFCFIADKNEKKANNLAKRSVYEVRCLKSNEDMILALAGQFKQLSHEPEKFFRFMRQFV